MAVCKGLIPTLRLHTVFTVSKQLQHHAFIHLSLIGEQRGLAEFKTSQPNFDTWRDTGTNY